MGHFARVVVLKRIYPEASFITLAYGEVILGHSASRYDVVTSFGHCENWLQSLALHLGLFYMSLDIIKPLTLSKMWLNASSTAALKHCVAGHYNVMDKALQLSIPYAVKLKVFKLQKNCKKKKKRGTGEK